MFEDMIMKKLLMIMTALALTTPGMANLLVDPGFENQSLGFVPDGPDIGVWMGFGSNAEIVDTIAHSGLLSAEFGANTTSYANLRQSYKPGDGPEAFENMDWVFGVWIYYDSSQAGNNPSTDAFNMECLVTNNWNIHLAHVSLTITPAMLNDGAWTYIEQTVTAGAATIDPADPEYDNKVTNRTSTVFAQVSPGQTGTFYIDDAFMDRANHWFDPMPADGESEVYPAQLLTLGWVNPSPNIPGNDILVDVVISPNSDLSNPVILLDNAVNATSVDASGILPLTTYYWQITAADGSDISVSPVLSFTTSNPNQVPVVDAGSDLLTYLTDGSVTVTMAATVTDESSTLNHWTFTKLPPEIADPVINPLDALNAAVTLIEAGEYTLTLSADDGEKIGTDDMVIYIGVNPCDAARRDPNGYVAYAADVNDDCQVTLADFVFIAQDWLQNNALTGPVVLP